MTEKRPYKNCELIILAVGVQCTITSTGGARDPLAHHTSWFVLCSRLCTFYVILRTRIDGVGSCQLFLSLVQILTLETTRKFAFDSLFYETVIMVTSLDRNRKYTIYVTWCLVPHYGCYCQHLHFTCVFNVINVNLYLSFHHLFDNSYENNLNRHKSEIYFSF